MKIYLLSNNLVLEGITYESNDSLEQKRESRPLSIEGELLAKKLAEDITVQNIYSSNYASAIATAKYFSEKRNSIININSLLNDSKIGKIERHNIKMLRFMQERNFDFKYDCGESINETNNRITKVFTNILKNITNDTLIVTHKRAILALLLNYCEKGYNLNDRLILSYNEKVILDDTDTLFDLIELTVENGKILSIDILE